LPFKVYHERGTFSVPPPKEAGFLLATPHLNPLQRRGLELLIF